MDVKKICGRIHHYQITEMWAIMFLFLISYFIINVGPSAAATRELLRTHGEQLEVKIAERIGLNAVRMTNYTFFLVCAPVLIDAIRSHENISSREENANVGRYLPVAQVKDRRLVNTMYDIKMTVTEDCKVLCGYGGKEAISAYFDFVWTTVEGRAIKTLIHGYSRFKITVDNVMCDSDTWDPLGISFGYVNQVGSRYLTLLYLHLSFLIGYQQVDENLDLRKVTECNVHQDTQPVDGYFFDGGKCSLPSLTSKGILPVHEDDETEVVFSYSVKWIANPKKSSRQQQNLQHQTFNVSTSHHAKWKANPKKSSRQQQNLQHQTFNVSVDRHPNNTDELNPDRERQKLQKTNDSSFRNTIAIAIAVTFVAVIAMCFAIVWIRRQRIVNHFRHHTETVVNDVNIPLESNTLQEEIFGYSCEYDYTPSKIIGRGHFGTVYKATITKYSGISVQRDGAVKITHIVGESMALTEAEKNRLQQLVLLRYEYLVAYHMITIARRQTGTTAELLMDYCNGGDLASLLKSLRDNDELLRETLAFGYAIEITRGLDFLHRKQFLHGDIKPENIMVRERGTAGERLLIGDLDDIVKMLRSTTASQDVKHLRGTIRYMSPEMLKKFAVDPTDSVGRKTDIWSLGCILLDLSSHVTGNYDRWLVNLEKRIQIGDEMPQHRFATLILDGCSHLVPDNPALLSAVTRQCLRVASEARLSAEQVLQQLLILAAKVNN